MSTNNGCCGGSSTTTCDSAIAELPRYYPRQLITPDDLTLEQNYFRDRMRRHNRLLHGWGVACGAIVCPATTVNADGTTQFIRWQVKVQRGYILGPYGDEITIDCTRTVDLRSAGVTGATGQPCVDAPDPWCSQVFTVPSTTNVFFLAVKYKQTMMRPVRVQPAGCGCDDASCEYSRLQDGYTIGVLTSCPVCNACDPSQTPPSSRLFGEGPIPDCPDCTCGPWVCLAQVTLASDGSGNIQQIDNSSCRRMVVSFCNSWWQSSGNASGANASSITSVTGAAAGTLPVAVTADGQTAVQLTVTGTNLEIGPQGSSLVTYSFGPGILVSVLNQTAALQTGMSSVLLSVTAQTSVNPGIYNLTVVNADCSVILRGNAIRVIAPANQIAAGQFGQGNAGNLRSAAAVRQSSAQKTAPGGRSAAPKSPAKTKPAQAAETTA